MNRLFPIDGPSRVAEVRRYAGMVARNESVPESSCAKVEIVATEIATNLVKHASKGEVYIASLSELGCPGIEILSIDRGPGMSSVDQCIRDGFSSSGTAGSGLGAIVRSSDEFDAYSVPDKGTVLVSRMWAGAAPQNVSAAFICVPIRGEEESGDSWAIHSDSHRLSLIVADGLGHGILAAEASKEAVAAFRANTDASPVAMLDQVHRRLRGTRGAAVAIAQLDLNESKLKYAGIGNVCGSVTGGPRVQSMVSHNGTAGHEARKLQEFSYDLPDPWMVIMHSDGISTSWNLDHYAGLVHRHPALIAGTLYRDAARHRDDICIVVVKKLK